MNPITDAITQRRSCYQLGNALPHSAQEISALIQTTMRHAPSAFHSQSSRALILFNQEHHKLWDLTKVELKKVAPPEAFAASEAKIEQSFRAGFGTVLFFEDQDVVAHLQQQFALYADSFPVYSEHSSAIAQYAVWLALGSLNIGASLQHYNPLIDDAVAQNWQVPANWKLRAQMPFGSILGTFEPKSFIDSASQFIVAGL